MRLLALSFSLLLLSGTSCGGPIAQPPILPPTSGYTLAWSDEFSSANGSAPDATKWAYDLGGGGWGNQELESYTSRTQNVQIQNGNLVITALQENYTGTDGIARNYTSARLKTQNLFTQTYGRFEARIKIPKGQGIWPAFWMLGNDISQNGWPKCGEIDIMENIGREPGIVHGSLHGPSSVAHTSDSTSTVSLPPGKNYSDDFHIYAIQWEPGTVRFYVDSDNYANLTQAQWPVGGQWVFDHPFFMIMNVAIGGVWPGSPDASTQFPQQMLVDYVRVYSKN
jgi:beta-glucanase (GH16 family)